MHLFSSLWTQSNIASALSRWLGMWYSFFVLSHNWQQRYILVLVSYSRETAHYCFSPLGLRHSKAEFKGVGGCRLWRKLLCGSDWKKIYQNSLAGVFQWPKNNDRDQVPPKFIFCRNLEVTNDENNTSVYLVKNLEGIRTKFRNFSRKYFL